MSCTVCATIFATPILLSSFGYVSVLSLVSNLLVVGVTAICFIGGFLLCVSAAMIPALAPVIARMFMPFLDYILMGCEPSSRHPAGMVNWRDSFGLAALAVSLRPGAALADRRKHVKWREIVLPCVCILVAGLSWRRRNTITGSNTQGNLPAVQFRAGGRYG